MNVTRQTLLAVALVAVTASGRMQTPQYSNPVIPGDHPDPSVIRVGREYWATATTSQWAPIFPLLRSNDLVNWSLEGAVFQEPPAWSAGSYWAPEIAEDRGRFFVYYTARRRNGPLCVAVATASKPAGPWTDHGPLVCQDAGSIDAMAVSDVSGRRYLVWKEDGNSRKLPTPLWAQPLSTDGTSLVGKPVEILRNEAAWEGHLVEGPFILRRDGWFFLFYSAGACCGRNCDYRLGVARSRTILGPWERNPANPILQGNAQWKCPGHGSLVTLPDARTFLLYHAYHPQDFEYAGRQGLLDEVTWEQGWPVINGGGGPSGAAPAARVSTPEHPTTIVDEFDSPRLNPQWQWPWDRTPAWSIDAGVLAVQAAGRDPADPTDTIIGRPALTGNYTAIVRVRRTGTTALAGLSVYGNAANAIGLSISGSQAILWRREKGSQRTVTAVDAPAGDVAHLRVTAATGSRFQFAISADGTTWQSIGDPAQASNLPPWNLAVRIALAVGGPKGSAGAFESISIQQGN